MDEIRKASCQLNNASIINCIITRKLLMKTSFDETNIVLVHILYTSAETVTKLIQIKSSLFWRVPSDIMYCIYSLVENNKQYYTLFQTLLVKFSTAGTDCRIMVKLSSQVYRFVYDTIANALDTFNYKEVLESGIVIRIFLNQKHAMMH